MVVARTHQNPAVETPGTDSDDDVLADTFQNFRARNEEAIALGLSALVLVRDSVLVGNFLDRVGFTSCTRLVANDVMTAEENTIDRQNFTRFD